MLLLLSCWLGIILVLFDPLYIQMNKLVLIALPFLLLVAECISYSLDLSVHAFWGIAKAAPKFRDFHILPLNALCSIEIPDFYTTGSCSDQLYGIPAGSFDYPALIFYIARMVPDSIFHHPSILAILNGIVFLISMFMYCLVKKSHINYYSVFTIYIFLFSHPVRYALERGQLDLITWSMTLFSCVLMTASLAYPKIKHRKYDLYLSPSKLLQHFSLFFIALSAAIKAFTFGAYSIFWMYFAKKTSKSYKLITSLLYILVIMLILHPVGLPGKNASLVQSMPGEIFGFSVGASGELAKYALKTLVCISGVFVSICTINYDYSNLKRNYIDTTRIPFIFEPLAISGASSFCMFYFLSSSANYKLISAGLFLVGVSLISPRLFYPKPEWDNHLNRNPMSLFRIIASVSCISVLYHNYRPYIEELEFVSQGQFDFLWCPLLAGMCVGYLFLVISRMANLSLLSKKL